MILAGSTVRTENVLVLASLFDGGELAAKLERAVANGNTIVALSLADRQRIVAMLGVNAPSGFAELRRVLVEQLARHEAREKSVRQALHDDHSRRRRERLG